MVDIVDIGMGNVRSIRNVLSRLGLESNIVSCPESLSSHTLILPGVGSASPFMKKLHSTKLDCSIREHVNRGNKLIGICLGFQVMTLFSEEDGGTQCLGLINTNTVSINRFHHHTNHNQWEHFSLKKEDLSLPVITSPTRSRKRVVKGRVFYNHEYGVQVPPNSPHFKSINLDSLSSFAAIYSSDNVIGIQFHPEKSQVTGLELFSMIL